MVQEPWQLTEHTTTVARRSVAMEIELLTLPGRQRGKPQDLGFQLPHVPLAAANDPGELEYMKGLTERGLHNAVSMRSFSIVGWKFVVIQLCGVNPPVLGEYAQNSLVHHVGL